TEDPWRQLVRNFPVGSIVEGTVTKLVSFGAFVELADNIEGLVHISEMATKHIESPAQVVHVGDTVQVKLQEIDAERRRISLSMRAAAETLGLEIEVAEPDPSMIKPKLKNRKEKAAGDDTEATEATEAAETAETAEDTEAAEAAGAAEVTEVAAASEEPVAAIAANEPEPGMPSTAAEPVTEISAPAEMAASSEPEVLLDSDSMATDAVL
ncbi:MAG: S1 RNA-binding domain-containing protein, partial [Actinomycetia bacterium]|nr:S1 RNA-binding domain-containing protein [Actinomycetes bacterium]